MKFSIKDISLIELKELQNWLSKKDWTQQSFVG